MNRAFNCDELAIWLEKTKFWKDIPGTSQAPQAVDGAAGQGYANDQAIENRVVDDVEANPAEQCRGEQ